MSPFFRKGFCSEILWRCFFTVFLGGDFFSEVVLVEYFPQKYWVDFFSKICLIDVFVFLADFFQGSFGRYCSSQFSGKDVFWYMGRHDFSSGFFGWIFSSEILVEAFFFQLFGGNA